MAIHRTARLLGLDIAGIDLLFDGDHYRICEANSFAWISGNRTMPVAVRLGKLEYLSKANRVVMAGPNVAADTRAATAVERNLRKVEEAIDSVDDAETAPR